MSKKVNKARLFRNTILLLLVAGCAIIYFSNRYVKSKGFDNLNDFIETYSTNKGLADNAAPKLVELVIDEKDYQFLENRRQESLDRGIQVNKGDNYVNCKVVVDGDTTKGEMRLKGHMTDHLEGDKWSFRVKTKDEVMGMYRFSLQNPATRNYAYEWVYHQLLEYENIIHLKYDFVHLKLNDKDLGIYAVEEHFGQHILRDNNRPPGAILRWNPGLYWEHRLDELDGLYLDEGYSSYASSFPEAYDKGVVKDEPELVETYKMAAAQLEAFRRGEKSTAEVFDVQKMAVFHAVIDLVGGYHSLDWSDVKFYYNASSERIEPVGYESFSVRETVKIAGQRTPEDYRSAGFNYHDRLFADPVFFAAYIQAIERICDEAYFEAFTKSIEPELGQKRGILAREFAYIKFSYEPYYENIERIRHNIELPKPLHAFKEKETDSTVVIAVTPVSDYPIQIEGLISNGKNEFKLDSTFVLPPKARNTFAHYFYLTFKHNGKKIKDLELIGHIPGSKHEFTVLVSDLPSFMGAKSDSIAAGSDSDSSLVWVDDETALFKEDFIQLNHQVHIPKGKKLIVNPGQQLVFGANGGLIVEGELQCLGTQERLIHFSAENKSSELIQVLGGSVTLANVQVYDLQSSFLVANSSEVSVEACVFADTESHLFNAKLSTLTFANCASGNMESLGQFDRCALKLKSFTGKNGGTFLVGYGSDIEMHTSKLEGFQLVADLNYNANFSSWSSIFKGNQVLGKLNNVSVFNTYGSTILSGEKGFCLDHESDLLGASSYLLYKTNSDQLDQIEIPVG